LSTLWARASRATPRRRVVERTPPPVQRRATALSSELIVNLKRIPDLSGVRTEAGAFVIGAATPCAVLGEHAALARAWPGVVAAAT
jgi:carbon-monoxide dehydrogenase medium subunit